MQTVEIEATELRKNTLYDQVTFHRAMTSRKPLEIGTSYLTQKTCISDEVKLWNLPPVELKNATTLYAMKKATRIYVKTLPI